MTVTITLSPEAEARLRRRAEQQGQPIGQVAEAMLEQALTVDPDDLSDEAVAEIRAGIRRGLEAAASGRERPLAEYAREVRNRQGGS